MSSTVDLEIIDTDSKPKPESKLKPLPKKWEKDDENDDEEEAVQIASKMNEDELLVTSDEVQQVDFEVVTLS